MSRAEGSYFCAFHYNSCSNNLKLHHAFKCNPPQYIIRMPSYQLIIWGCYRMWKMWWRVNTILKLQNSALVRMKGIVNPWECYNRQYSNLLWLLSLFPQLIFWCPLMPLNWVSQMNVDTPLLLRCTSPTLQRRLIYCICLLSLLNVISINVSVNLLHVLSLHSQFCPVVYN